MINPTSMLYWWPLTQSIGVPDPRTEIVPLAEPTDATVFLYTCTVHHPADVDPKNPDCRNRLDALYDRCVAVTRRIGFPLFLRTDLTSGKHGWAHTCYVASEDVLRQHIAAVVEEHGVAMWMEGPAGALGALVFREFLTLDAPFTAFAEMPVARERRYFVDDGKVVCHHPYWEDEDNIARGIGYRGNVFEPKWRDMLADLNAEDAAEVAVLTMYAERVAKVIPGAWSVDFAFERGGGWRLIDMAVADRSWHPEHPEED